MLISDQHCLPPSNIGEVYKDEPQQWGSDRVSKHTQKQKKHTHSNMSSKVKMPTVHIPVLRQSTAVLGTGLFSQPPPTSDTAASPDNGVFIEELVQGVRHCQAAVKRAGETLRRSRAASDDQPNQDKQQQQHRRVRSPTPIGDRKPWGASTHSATPSPRNANAPTTVAKAAVPTTARPSSATVRSATPTSDAGGVHGAAKPSLLRGSPPSTTKKNVGQVRPKVDHHTPPTLRRSLSGHTTGASPAGHVSEEVEQRVEALSQHVKSLDDQLATTTERAEKAEAKVMQLEARIAQMQNDSDATQISARQQFLHFSAQQQHMWEVIRRLESFLVADSYGDDDMGSAAAAAGPGGAATLLNDSRGSTSSRGRPAAMGHHAATAGGSGHWDGGSVVRRLDLSNESQHSRVPPNPPMELRHQ